MNTHELPGRGPGAPVSYDVPSYAHRVLLETDRLYFELGALRSSSGLDLLYVPEYIGSPSGSVVWGVDRTSAGNHFAGMLKRAEVELRQLGGRALRVYIENPVPRQIAHALEASGYRPRVEVALLAEVSTVLASTDVPKDYEFLKVENDQHWRLKEELHATEEKQADGYATDARDWVGLERMKCATGGMACYLVMRDSQPIAAVGLILDRGIARLKNLFVTPACRKGGIGLATIRLLAGAAHAQGYQWFGCFALENGNAIRVYQRAGLRVVAAATEFSRDLVPDDAA